VHLIHSRPNKGNYSVQTKMQLLPSDQSITIFAVVKKLNFSQNQTRAELVFPRRFRFTKGVVSLRFQKAIRFLFFGKLPNQPKSPQYQSVRRKSEDRSRVVTHLNSHSSTLQILVITVLQSATSKRLF